MRSPTQIFSVKRKQLEHLRDVAWHVDQAIAQAISGGWVLSDDGHVHIFEPAAALSVLNKAMYELTRSGRVTGYSMSVDPGGLGKVYVILSYSCPVAGFTRSVEKRFCLSSHG